MRHMMFKALEMGQPTKCFPDDRRGIGCISIAQMPKNPHVL